jgi:hypothetical protein
LLSDAEREEKRTGREDDPPWNCHEPLPEAV